MEAEIIAVGTELLLGDIVNTNAQFLSKELAALGIDVHVQTVVGDNPARLRGVIDIARGRSDLLIFSGGLGPTEDDLTKQIVAEAFGDALQFDPEECAKIEEFFARWGRTMPENNKKQAYVPVSGRKLPNENGTAPGMIFFDKAAEQYAVLLPGPPSELKPMFQAQVRPWLETKSSNVLHSVTLRVTGVGESHLEERLQQFLAGENPTVGLYAKTAEVFVRVTAKGESLFGAKALGAVTVEAIEALLGDAVYGRDETTLEQAVVEGMAAQGKTLALAESCTGGMLAQRITTVSGASKVLGFGFVTYANEAKRELLGVNAQTLEKYGAVSSETAAEMAQGARNVAGATVGVAITGVAGPTGGTPQKPVGLVYLAAATQQAVFVQRILVTNRPRDTVRAFAVQHALELLRRTALGLPQTVARQFPVNTLAHWQNAAKAEDI